MPRDPGRERLASSIPGELALAAAVAVILAALIAHVVVGALGGLVGNSVGALTSLPVLAADLAIALTLGMIGIATRRIALSSGIGAPLLLVLTCWEASRGAPSEGPWLRLITLSTLLPIVNGCALAVLRKRANTD